MVFEMHACKTTVPWLQGDVIIFCTGTDHNCCIFDKAASITFSQKSINTPVIQWAPAGRMGGDFEAINADSER